MKLIDRDKLYNAICKPSDLPDDVINVCEIRLAIINQPTVEAIPVEWIKETIKLAESVQANEYAEHLRILLEDWEEENEQNKKNTSQTD